MFEWYICKFRLFNAKINFCSVKPFNSLNLYPIEKYQKYFQVKTSKELLDRIENPKKVKVK